MKQHTWIVGAVAAMLIAAPSVKAQDATATPPVALTATPVTDIPVIPMPDSVDYSVLRNEPFVPADLKAAEARGFSDGEIASAAKIAKITGYPFNSIIAQMENGMTFSSFSTRYGIPIGDIYDVSDEEAKIADYKKAVDTTGYAALRTMRMNGTASDAMAPGSMAPAMTPPATPTAATPPPAAPTGDIVDVASADPNLSTLVQAIQAAGLVDTLKGSGPFTVFAPDNRAFARIPKAKLSALLADPAALKNILTYHVIAGQKIDAATAMSMTSPTSPPTVQGGTLTVTTRGGRVHVNNATVTQADIQATNGVIHVINRVLMPSADTTAAAPGAVATPGTGGQ